MPELKRISSRIAAIAESATLKVDAKAKSLQAAGRPVISYAAGEPDFPTPGHIVEAALAAVTDPKNHRYTPAAGLPDLREAIVAKTKRDSGLEVPATQVVVTNGGKQAVYESIVAVVDDGDEVVMFEPWFDIYGAGISLARGVRVGVPLAGPRLRPDLDRLRSAITPRTRVLLLNSPHNPTGIVMTREELEGIAAIAIEHDLVVISDEAYEHLWFDGHPHIPISTLPGMFERTVTVGSGGKSFSFTGWKVGWASGPAHLISAVRVVRQHLSYVSGGPFQFAMAAGLRLPDSYFTDFRADLSDKRDLLSTGLAGLGFGVLESEGTYFLTTDVRPLGYADGLQFCRDMPHRAGVVAIPHQALCDDPAIGAPYVRWAFCKRPSVLQEALERLERGLR